MNAGSAEKVSAQSYIIYELKIICNFEKRNFNNFRWFYDHSFTRLG
jgi:hypothetical protein